MKKIKILAPIILLLLITISSKAQEDHLEPVSGILSDYNFQFEYHSDIRRILFNGLSDKPEIRFLTLASFSPENVLDIENIGNKYYLVYHVCDDGIWYSKNKDKIKVIKVKREISATSVELVKKLFKSAISQTRFSQADSDGLDGTDYYFSIYNSGLKTGTVWSPSKGTKMSRLVDIGKELIELTNKNNSILEFDKSFVAKIEEIIKAFE